MSLTVNFTATQSIAYPSQITLTDISAGVDNTIVNRRLYLILANGNYLNGTSETSSPFYFNWPYSNTSAVFDALIRTYSPSIRVEWWSASAKVYEITKAACFDIQDYIFALGLTMRQVANNSITQDTNWYNNKIQLIVNDNDAENAIIYISNITLSQNSLNRNYDMINNQNLYF